MHISILLMEQIIQLFLMIFMGFLIVKAKLLNSEDSKILSIIVLYLIIPCVIINAFQVDYTLQTVKGLLIALVGSVMTQVILLIVVSILGRVFHLNEVEVASIYYSNSQLNCTNRDVYFRKRMGSLWLYFYECTACIYMDTLQENYQPNPFMTGERLY